MTAFFNKIYNSVFYRRLDIIFLFSVVTALVFFPLLGGQNIVRDFVADDALYLTAGYNFFKPFSEALNGNFFTLWSPEIYGGFPVWLTQINFFSPLGIILFKFFDYILAYNWLLYFGFLLAGLAAYWLARNLNLSIASSVVAGLTYELSHVLLFPGTGNLVVFSDTYVFLPLLFVMILKLKEGRHFYILWTALVIAYGLIVGETQVVVYSLIAGLAFWLFLNWHDVRNRKISFPIWGFIAGLISGSVLAGLRIIPILNYLPYTVRTGRMPTIIYSFSWGDLLKYFYPFIESYAKSISPFSGYPFYIAVLSFFLAIAAIIFWRKNKFISFFVWLFALTLLLRIKFLGLAWLLSFIPILNRFRGLTVYWYYIGTLALAILAGFGLEYLDKIKERPNFNKYLKFLKIFAVLNVIVVAVINTAVIFQSKILALVLKYYDSHIYNPTKKFSLDYYHNVITETAHRMLYSFSLANPRFLFPFLFIIISIAALYIFYKDRISFFGFKTLAVIIIASNLVLVFFNYKVSPRTLIETVPDTAQFILNNSNSHLPFRVASFDHGDMYQKFEVFTIKDMDDYYLKTFYRNSNIYYGIEKIDGEDPFIPRSLLQILARAGFDVLYPSSEKISGSFSTSAEKVEYFTSESNSKLLGFLNVKYVLSSFEFPKTWKKVFETTATERKIPIYIYENPEFVERAYLVNKQGIKDNEGKVSIINYSAQYIKIEVKSAKENTLVFSEMNLPTWLAYIDGKPVEILTYKDLFMSLKVPTGEHKVEFIYPGLWQQFKLAAMQVL